MRSPHCVCRVFIASALALLSVACSDKSPVEPDPLTVLSANLIVSDPYFDSNPSAVTSQAGSAGSSLVAAAESEVAYVSLPAGSLPKAISFTIRNVSAGGDQSPLGAVLDGGFDPIQVVAKAGDELELRITDGAGAITISRAVVPRRSPPRVVRTSPPKGMIDVPLNSRILVVFTEPVAPATLTTATVRLLRGASLVPGAVRLVAGSLFAAEFIPAEELASGTAYRLVVTRGIRDTEGDSLETEVAADFTTVTSVPGISFSMIVAGLSHTCALRADGKTLCWGANYTGQLGAGNQVRAFGACPWENIPSNYNPFPCSNAPVTVVGGQTFASLTSGLFHSCALTAAGEAFCWGDNPYGELGADGAIFCNLNNPGPPSPPDKCSGIPLRVNGGLRFESIVAAYAHTCGIRVGGAAYCWGYEYDGTLGTGHAGIVASPAEVLGGVNFSSLTSGGSHTCGLTNTGAAYCWGLNELGQLGNGGDSPGQCTDDTSTIPCAKAPALVSGGLTFASLAAGVYHVCGLTTTGRAYCWGVLGSAYTEDSFEPSLEGSYGATPTPVNNELAFVSLSSGPTATHACAVTSANIAYCWGNNESGKLGDGSNTNSLVPVRVAGDLAFSAVAVGGSHSCGITTAGIVYCWGANYAGQLGVGNSASAGSLLPIRVAGQ